MAGRHTSPLLNYFKGTGQTAPVTERNEESCIRIPSDEGCENSEPTQAKKAQKQRAFKKAWKKEFDLLVYDKEAWKMFCQYCLDFPNSKNKLSSFFVGSQNFQLDGLRAHEQCAGHRLSVDAKATKSKQARGTINAAFMKMEKETEKLFNTAYYICYLKMPFSCFLHLCALQTKNGLVLGQTYLNDHGCKEFCKHISQVMKDEQAAIIKNARFLSILADVSTD